MMMMKSFLLLRPTLIILLSTAAVVVVVDAALVRISSRIAWQDDLLKSSKPLQPTPISEALSVLQRDGVVRISSSASCSVDPEQCATLRRWILEELGTDYGNMMKDKTYIPGTRLRFQDSIDLAFGGNARHDLLLPIQNCPPLNPVLQSAMTQLNSLLIDAANTLLPRLHGSTENSHSNHENLELVEVASLLVRPGSAHQQFHGDYRRFHQSTKESAAATAADDDNDDDKNEQEPLVHTQARMGKLPPRLVTFVALQDVPTIEHGATVFVTGTHNAKAHALVYDGQGISANNDVDNDDNDHDESAAAAAAAAALAARDSLLQLSTHGVVTANQFCQGDMLIYDASVLHWGGANSIPHNDRVMLYFGVARPNAAARLCDLTTTTTTKAVEGFKVAPPIVINDIISGKLFSKTTTPPPPPPDM